MQDNITAYLEEYKEEIIDKWRELVNIDGKADELERMDEVLEHLYAMFTDAGVKCRILTGNPEGPKVLSGVIGEDRPGKPVLLSGHYDTVFKQGTFGKDPFRIDEDGRVYGPGALDMKGGIVISLFVIKALEAEGYDKRPIRICFVGDEEGGRYHLEIAKYIEEAARGCEICLNMETGLVNNKVCVGRKGILTGTFTVHGISSHSGNDFEAGRNAIVEAAEKILKIDALTDMEKDTHMNVAVIGGGTVHNAIPGECRVLFSCRYKTAAERDRILNAIPEILSHPFIEGTSIECNISRAGDVFEETEANNRLAEFVDKVSRECGFGEVGTAFLGGASDAAYMSKLGIPTLCSCGVQGEWNHTDREYAVKDSMQRRTKLWCEVIKALG